MRTNIFAGFFLGISLFILSLFIVKGIDDIKKEDNYYDNINFDFIIPKPWYDQISEIKSLNFISDIVPYYILTRTLELNGKQIDVNLYIVEKNSNINLTPFSDNLSIAKKEAPENSIIIDEDVMKLLNTSVGDNISIAFGNKNENYNISRVVRKNKFSSSPTALVLYDGRLKDWIETSIERLSYSGAYISASDIKLAENYLNTDYHAMGNVGLRNWYKDDSAYQFMKKSIEETSFAKEITNVAQLKANTFSTSKENNKNNLRKTFNFLLVIFILNIICWMTVVFGRLSGIRHKIKLGTITESGIVKNFTFCEGLSFIVYLCLSMRNCQLLWIEV